MYEYTVYRIIHLENGVTALLISNPRKGNGKQGGKKNNKNGKLTKERDDQVSLSSSSSSEEISSVSSSDVESESEGDDKNSDGERLSTDGNTEDVDDAQAMKDETSLIQVCVCMCA